MRNWSVDTRELEKDPEAYAIWRLEQMVNFGTEEELISANMLEKYWDRLVLDPDKKRFLSFLLWGQTSLSQDN